MYSADRIEPQKLFVPVRRALTTRLEPDQPLVVALDDTRLRKSGRKTHGVKYTRDPMGPAFHLNLIKAQRCLQLSMASVGEEGMARMIPIDFVHAPPPRKLRRQADEQARAQWRQASRESALPRVGAQRVLRLRRAMDEEGQQNRRLWVLVDGGYTNRTFLKHLPERTTCVGRIRADAKLYELPASTNARTGRHRVYGQRVPTPEALRQDQSIPWTHVEAFAAGKRHSFKVKTLAPLRWRPAGKEHNLRLLVVAPVSYRLSKHSPLLYRKPAYLICTDPDASVEQILQTYIWRWDIEVNFRDQKTLLGVGQAQVRHERSVEKVPAVAVAAYAMLLTSATQLFGPTGKPDRLPAPKWRRQQTLRASTQSLINHLRQEVWARAIRFCSFASHTSSHPKPQKLESTLETALFYTAA
jgi:SRSO17 transposase